MTSEIVAHARQSAQRIPGHKGKYLDGPPELTPRHRLLIEYMTVGCSNKIICDKVDAQVGEPMRLESAADAVGIRRRGARDLMRTPIAQKALASSLAGLRNGAKARALHKVIQLIDEPGQSKAADHKVNLDAAQVILGDDAGKAAPSIHVSIHNQVVTPGYVIDLSDPHPLTIDHEDEPPSQSIPQPLDRNG